MKKNVSTILIQIFYFIFIEVLKKNWKGNVCFLNIKYFGYDTKLYPLVCETPVLGECRVVLHYHGSQVHTDLLF